MIGCSEDPCSDKPPVVVVVVVPPVVEVEVEDEQPDDGSDEDMTRFTVAMDRGDEEDECDEDGDEVGVVEVTVVAIDTGGMIER